MRRYIRTTLLGGIAAVLPLALVVIVFRWIINLIERFLGPIVELYPTESKYLPIAIYAILIVAILISFFFIGFIIETRIGKFLRSVLEQKYLMRIPGYRIARETVMQFFGKNRSFFSKVVLVNPFDTDVLMTGFITEDQGEVVTVFVPTGPNPTSGNIYHLPRERVLFTGTPVDDGMKTIISCGAGSSEIFGKADAEPGKREPGDEAAVTGP